MKEITIKLYSYEELSEEAKKKALDTWNEYNDDPYMQSNMINLLKEKLDERGIKYDADSVDVHYSLSYCQGDGFMFSGSYEYNGNKVVIEHHDNFYYHKYTAQMTWPDFVGEEKEEEENKIAEEFVGVYREICDEMERIGYDHIEHIQSEEYFIEVCEANGYTFEANGTMRNE